MGYLMIYNYRFVYLYEIEPYKVDNVGLSKNSVSQNQ